MVFIVVAYLALNIFSLILFGLDKYFAIHKKRRISEKTLLVSALCMGALGALLGMFGFHHKTKKPLFLFVVPLFLLLQMALLVFFLFLR